MPTKLTDISVQRPKGMKHLLVSFKGPAGLKQGVLILGPRSAPDLCVVKDFTDKGTSGSPGISKYEILLGAQPAEKTLLSTTKGKTLVSLFPLAPTPPLPTGGTNLTSLGIAENDPDWITIDVSKAFSGFWSKVWEKKWWILGIGGLLTLITVLLVGTLVVWKNWPSIQSFLADKFGQNSAPTSPSGNKGSSNRSPALDFPANMPGITVRGIANSNATSAAASSEISVQPGVPAVVVGNGNHNKIKKIEVDIKNYYRDGKHEGSEVTSKIVNLEALWAYGLTPVRLELPDPTRIDYPIKVRLPAHAAILYVKPIGFKIKPTVKINSPAEVMGAYNLGTMTKPKWVDWQSASEDICPEFLFQALDRDLEIVFEAKPFSSTNGSTNSITQSNP